MYNENYTSRISPIIVSKYEDIEKRCLELIDEIDHFTVCPRASHPESIEKQKAAINQSIAETQRLFDYTMDKYFG